MPAPILVPLPALYEFITNVLAVAPITAVCIPARGSVGLGYVFCDVCLS